MENEIEILIKINENKNNKINNKRNNNLNKGIINIKIILLIKNEINIRNLVVNIKRSQTFIKNYQLKIENMKKFEENNFNIFHIISSPISFLPGLFFNIYF